MMSDALVLLRNAQNADGGWGSVKGRRSKTEPTALAVMALQSRGERSLESDLERGIRWLEERQNADGGWPLDDVTHGSSWATALAMISLSSSPRHDSLVMKGAGWVIDQEGSKPGWLANLLFTLSFKKRAVNLNEDLKGWPWVSGTFSWVEPTSYSLMALKKLRRRLTGTNAAKRIEQGELMIYDRICEGGGWNYGNKVVFGEKLWPYPEVTAVALIALQDHPDAEPNRMSLRALEEMLKQVDSGLALSWSVICFDLYGKNTAEWKKRLVKNFEKTEFLGETKSVALSLLALWDGAKLFRA